MPFPHQTRWGRSPWTTTTPRSGGGSGDVRVRPTSRLDRLGFTETRVPRFKCLSRISSCRASAPKDVPCVRPNADRLNSPTLPIPHFLSPPHQANRHALPASRGETSGDATGERVDAGPAGGWRHPTNPTRQTRRPRPRKERPWSWSLAWGACRKFSGREAHSLRTKSVLFRVTCVSPTTTTAANGDGNAEVWFGDGNDRSNRNAPDDANARARSKHELDSMKRLVREKRRASENASFAPGARGTGQRYVQTHGRRERGGEGGTELSQELFPLNFPTEHVKRLRDCAYSSCVLDVLRLRRAHYLSNPAYQSRIYTSRPTDTFGVTRASASASANATRGSAEAAERAVVTQGRRTQDLTPADSEETQALGMDTEVLTTTETNPPTTNTNQTALPVPTRWMFQTPRRWRKLGRSCSE